MRKYFKTYTPFFRSGLMHILTYRVKMLLWFLVNALLMLALFFFWKAVYNSSDSNMLNGFTRNEMLMYVLLSFIVNGIVIIEVAWTVGYDIKEGNIAMSMIKPISYRTRVFFEELGAMIGYYIIAIIPSIIMIIVLNNIYNLEFSLTLSQVIFGGIIMILAIIIKFFFSFILGNLSMYTTEVYGILWFASSLERFLTGALIPLVFFPSVVAKILSYLPFAGLVYTPVMILLGKITGEELIRALAIQLVWAIVLYIVSNRLFKKTIKRLVILGG